MVDGAGLGFVVECGGECDLGVGVCRFVLARVRRARSRARDLSWRLWAEECGARGLGFLPEAFGVAGVLGKGVVWFLLDSTVSESVSE